MIHPSRSPAGPAAVARHYGDLDRYYREIWGEHVHHGLWTDGDESPEEAVEALVEEVARRAALAPGHRVWDVGSGYGATARLLARRWGARVTAVTLSPVQHERACSVPRLEGDPTYLRGDWLEIEPPLPVADAVVAVESTEHMGDLRAAVGRMHDSLRPGGRLVACVWLSRPSPSAWEVRHLLGPICREGRLARLTTAEEYVAVLREAGFAQIEVEDVSGRVARTWTLCLARAVRRMATDSEARRFLLDRTQPERVFARTLVRIRIAYAVGSLRYGIVSARRPG